MLLFFGDLHINHKNYQTVAKLLRNTIRQMQNVEGIVFLGDIFDNPNISSSQISSTTVFIKGFAEVIAEYPDIPIVLIEGNHDQPTGSYLAPIYLMNVAKSRNIHVVGQGIIRTFVIGNYSVTCIPWLNEIQQQQHGGKQGILDTIIKLGQTSEKIHNRTDILCGHLEISGARNNNYVLAKSYVQFSAEELESLDYQYHLFGHIHAAQKISECVYVGSLLQNDWGEEGNVSRVAAIDDDGLHFYPIEGVPQYETLSFNSAAEFDTWVKLADTNRMYRIFVPDDVVIKVPPNVQHNVSIRVQSAQKMSNRITNLADLDVDCIQPIDIVRLGIEAYPDRVANPDRLIEYYKNTQQKIQGE